MTSLLFSLALVAGAAQVVGLSLNVQLGKDLGSPLLAGTGAFLVGTVALTAISLVAEPWPSLVTLARVEWWAWAGGLLGALYLVANLFLIPCLGALNTFGLAITGQMLGSLYIDQFGLLSVPVDPLTAGSIVGALLALFGTGLITQIYKEVAHISREKLGLIASSLLVGTALPVMAAVNAKLREEISAPLLSGSISFAIGTGALSIVLGTVFAATRQSLPQLARVRRGPWWAWLGGLFAAFYVDATLVLVPLLGASAAIGLTIAGQQLASGLVDHFGLMRMPRRPPTRRRVGGVLLLLVGVILIQVF